MLQKYLSKIFAPGIGMRILPYVCLNLAIVANGINNGIINSIQASEQWQTFFEFPSGSTLGILNSISILGMVLGNVIAPWTANDRFGRKICTAIGCCMLILATGLQAGAKNIGMYLAARFILGLGSIYVHQAAPAFLSEFAAPSERTAILGLYLPNMYLGNVVIGWVCYSTVTWSSNWSWQVPSMVQAIPPLLQLALLPFVPESPRWLVVHGQTEKAREVLIKYHGQGEETEVVACTLQEIIDSVEDEKTGHRSGGWLDLVGTKDMRIRTVIAALVGIASQWSGNGIITYYLTTVLKSAGITSPKTQTMFTAFLNLYTYLFATGLAPLTSLFGRRPIFMTALISMLLIWITFTGLSAGYIQTGHKAMASGVLGMLFLYQTAYGAVWVTLFMFPVELFPSALRARGLAAQNSIDYLGLFLNVYVNPMAMDAIKWKYYLVYVPVIVVQMVVVYFLFPETAGYPLEVVEQYFIDHPRWFSGPKSKKLMAETAARHGARLTELSGAAVANFHDVETPEAPSRNESFSGEKDVTRVQTVPTLSD
ncbi:hypothetical protein I350_06552 [Cryptococcus amylolentus CBS 6273]|uniref:Major facilitator superfamily (MFS) profile domain-containing protein n=1 Tax=Cryptococcus amylolentus CBS 6273 TaxID=1296118 RepID=A0A1E3JLI2_9TREE|nr:hypothetical protein I350_06552 [Cryptococcus amylolentus CBS 6273]